MGAKRTGPQGVHDLLVEHLPDGKTHEPCGYCTDQEDTMTDEELQAKIDTAVQAAVAAKDARIAELEADAEKSVTDSKVADAVAAALEPLETKVAELQTELDTKAAELKATTDDRDAIVAKIDEDAATAALETKKTERVAAVTELGCFDEKHIEANTERWASMDDDLWGPQLEEYKLLAAKTAKPGSGIKPQPLPNATAMTAGAEGGNEGGDSHLSPRRRVMSLGAKSVETVS